MIVNGRRGGLCLVSKALTLALVFISAFSKKIFDMLFLRVPPPFLSIDNVTYALLRDLYLYSKDFSFFLATFCPSSAITHPQLLGSGDAPKSMYSSCLINY